MIGELTRLVLSASPKFYGVQMRIHVHNVRSNVVFDCFVCCVSGSSGVVRDDKVLRVSADCTLCDILSDFSIRVMK